MTLVAGSGGAWLVSQKWEWAAICMWWAPRVVGDQEQGWRWEGHMMAIPSRWAWYRRVPGVCSHGVDAE